MKKILSILFIVFSGNVLSEGFEARLASAKDTAASEPGKAYEKVVRESSWDTNSKCFHESSKVRATPGYYQLVATIEESGTAYAVEVKPAHHYAKCVAAWFSKHKFPAPPKNNWPVFLDVNIQP